ncbi:HupE/UreJ family protein [Planktomarina sp.]|nr:HupE/UreJ family protein [Planktomarina sp.]
MMKPFKVLTTMVSRIVVMSSAIVLALIFGTVLQAHELRPAVAKVEVSETELKIELLVAIETLLAGIDLTEILDTDEAPEAAIYDTLRGLDDDALAENVWAEWPQLSTEFIMEGAEALRLVNVEVIPEPDMELTRDTKLFMVTKLLEGSAPVRFGWTAKNGGLVVRHGEGDDAYAGFLEGGELSLPLPRSGAVEESGTAVFWRFVIEGFEHIIPKGLDHILFVFGLFLFSLSWRPLLSQITAFTVAHTVTLGLTTLSIVKIPAAQIWLVEALIAVSITYVAIENIWRPKLGWWRVVVVFGFGLLHGIGFASVLGDLGLAQGQFVLSLIAFNIGVEGGQLAVIAIGFITLALPFGKSHSYRSYVVIPGSIAIALVGGWWAFERIFL